MPNWCDCELHVYGKPTELKRLKETAQGDRPLDFNKITPYPKAWAELDKKSQEWWDAFQKLTPTQRMEWEKTNPRPKDGYNSGGYDWCNNNWGVKWNASEPSLRECKRSMVYNFDTAWGPPYLIVEKLGKMFPTLRFVLKYFEQGCAFQGKFVVEQGKAVSNEQKEYHGHRGG